MKGKAGFKKLLWKTYQAHKRVLVFLLTVTIILTNIGADINIVLAAGISDSITFSMSGSQLLAAIEYAVVNGSEVTKEDINFTDGKAAKFEKLFFGEGNLYEVFPEVEGESLDAQLRVFVRLPGDSDVTYRITGNEELILLYVNNGDQTLNCTTDILRTEAGVSKVKRTKHVVIKSYETAFGVEEGKTVSNSNGISVPEETDMLAKEDQSAAEEESGAVSWVDQSAAEEESGAVSKEDQTAADEESGVVSKEDQTEAGEESGAVSKEDQTEAGEESGVVSKEDQSAAEEESGVVSKEDQSAMPEESAAMSNEAQTAIYEESAEKLNFVGETEQNPEVSMASVIRHDVPIVMEKVSGTGDDLEAGVVSDAKVKAPETFPVVVSHEGTAEVSVATAADAANPAEEELTADDKVSAAEADDLAGIGYCSTAKAYVTTINQLKALDDIQGYKITYTVNPEMGARIIEGPRGVEDGQELSFGVKNQIGYKIEAVSVNGETLQSESVTDNHDGSQTAWYLIRDIHGKQDILINMAETEAHPAVELPPILMDDGMVIAISAGLGVLPAGVTASASRVSTQLEEAVKQTANDMQWGKETASVAAYDINLWLGDQLLDSQIWGGNHLVHVNFSGAPIEDQSSTADTLEVLYVETVQDKDQTAKTKAAKEELEVKPEDIVKLELVGETIAVDGETPVDTVAFDAEHFSIYAVVGSWVQSKLTLRPNQTAVLQADVLSDKYDWSINQEEDIISITGGQGTSQITIKAGPLKNKKVKKAVITCRYGDGQQETFKITVNANNAYTGYFYIRKPGTEQNNEIDYQDAWYYAGKVDSAIVGLKNPSNKHTIYKDWQPYIAGFPDRYPIIKSNDKEYTYSSTKEPKTYGIEWQYVKEESGANNGHESIVSPEIYTYHVDGYATLYDTDYFTVNFKVKEPDSPNFSLVDGYTVEQGKLISELPLPNMVADNPKDGEIQSPVIMNGVPYEFDGWYTDEACTAKVDFQNSGHGVDSTLNYYGRYLEQFHGMLAYDLNADDATWDTAPNDLVMKDHQYLSGKFYNKNSKVTAPIKIPSRPGYDFVKWNSGSQGDGKQNAAAGMTFDYPENSGKLIMYAIWKPKEILTVTIAGIQEKKEYNGKEQQAVGFTSDAPSDVTVKLNKGKAPVAKGTDAGTYGMGLTEADFEVTTKNPQYLEIVVKVTDGSLTITPKTEVLTVKITGNHNTLEYIGNEQSVSGYECDAPANVKVTLIKGKEAAAKGITVGTYLMYLEEKDFTADSPNYENIKIIVEDGSLTITPATETLTVTITGSQATRIYNGEKQRVSGFTSNAPCSVLVSLRSGREAAAEGSAVDTYYMGLGPDDFEVSSPNYANIEVVVVDGTLTITPADEESGGGENPQTGGGSTGEDPQTGGGSTGEDPQTGGGSTGENPQTGGGSTGEDPQTGGGSTGEDPQTGGGSTGESHQTGGGSSYGPHIGGGPVNGGPGTATLLPEKVPLAALPNESQPIDRLILINGSETLLENLPKTGRTSANGWMLFVSSLMLTAYTTVFKKKHKKL